MTSQMRLAGVHSSKLPILMRWVVSIFSLIPRLDMWPGNETMVCIVLDVIM